MCNLKTLSANFSVDYNHRNLMQNVLRLAPGQKGKRKKKKKEAGEER